jgi:hypothetical protein
MRDLLAMGCWRFGSHVLSQVRACCGGEFGAGWWHMCAVHALPQQSCLRAVGDYCGILVASLRGMNPSKMHQDSVDSSLQTCDMINVCLCITWCHTSGGVSVVRFIHVPSRTFGSPLGLGVAACCGTAASEAVS